MFIESRLPKWIAFATIFMFMFASLACASEPNPPPSSPPTPQIVYVIATATPSRPPPARTTVQGLGISRAEIQVAFSQPEMGWVSMESAPLADGTPRQLAKFDFGNATLEMIGPDKNLTSVAVFVDDSIDGDADYFFNALYLSMLLDMTVPEWNRSSEWLAVNIGIADEGGKPVRFYDGKAISLRTYTATETIMVKVEVDSQG